jgi:hypothetical protein
VEPPASDDVIEQAPSDNSELPEAVMGDAAIADAGPDVQEGRQTAAFLRLGSEGLARLRARYAEMMARITDRPLEEAAREELKSRAESLNPDAWVTDDEVQQGLEQYESVFEGLRSVVGHPRRRRRRRG